MSLNIWKPLIFGSRNPKNGRYAFSMEKAGSRGSAVQSKVSPVHAGTGFRGMARRAIYQPPCSPSRGYTHLLKRSGRQLQLTLTCNEDVIKGAAETSPTSDGGEPMQTGLRPFASTAESATPSGLFSIPWVQPRVASRTSATLGLRSKRRWRYAPVSITPMQGRG